jgi:ubiquinone/menaquinone biosynthesis C-methylase UbiE
VLRDGGVPAALGGLQDQVDLFASPSWLKLHHEVKLPQRREFIRGLNVPAGARVLDVACGVGGWSWLALEEIEGSKVVAFDQDIENLREAVRLGGEDSHLRSAPLFLQASMSQLPFHDERFDIILLFNALQHAALTPTLLDTYALLKPGGRLIVRNFDEALVSVFPCRPALLGKVLWAVAEEAENNPDINPYAGRQLHDLLRAHVRGRTKTWATATTITYPFTQAQRVYVTRNVALQR